jgi:hypothetical protein
MGEIAMTSETKEFLEALLFAYNWEDTDEDESAYTVYDFSEEYIEAVESFMEGFSRFLARNMHDDLLNDMDNLEGSFGGNVYFSLSGHGVGFWSDSDTRLGEAYQALLEQYSGNKYRFEDLGIWFNEGKLELPTTDPEIYFGNTKTN